MDLDVLEIWSSDGLDYNYLVQHFLITFMEDHLHHTFEDLRRVPVILRCKRGDISLNTYNLLSDKFKEVREEGKGWMRGRDGLDGW